MRFDLETKFHSTEVFCTHSHLFSARDFVHYVLFWLFIPIL